jgi:hypothetical protein
MASGSKIVDIHAHCIVAEAAAVTNHPLQAPVLLWSNVSDRIAEKETQRGAMSRHSASS